MIQIITYEKSNFESFSNDYKISELGEFDSFDDYKINIIDLTNEQIWEFNGDSYKSLNCISDLKTLSKELKSTNKSKTIIVLPQNCNFKYLKDYRGNYTKVIKIKNILSSVIEIISKNLFEICGFELSYSKNTTIIDDMCYNSDFNFNQVVPKSFTPITKSKSSDKNTTIIYENIIITSLNIFETKQHLSSFIKPLLVSDKEKTAIPEWMNDINFFNDKDLKDNKSKNNDEIKLLQEKNNEIDVKLENNNKIKSILYTTGDELVEVVMKILDDMLENDSSDFIDEKKEDFLIKKDSITFVGEIKGISSAISNKNVSQLDVHVQDYIDKILENGTNEKVKGLLIVNHQRNKKIEERNDVHKNQIDLATRNGALIIESTTLLYLYEKFLEKTMNSQKILKILTDRVGILQKNDVK